MGALAEATMAGAEERWSSPDFVDRFQGFTEMIVGVVARHCS